MLTILNEDFDLSYKSRYESQTQTQFNKTKQLVISMLSLLCSQTCVSKPTTSQQRPHVKNDQPKPQAAQINVWSG